MKRIFIFVLAIAPIGAFAAAPSHRPRRVPLDTLRLWNRIWKSRTARVPVDIHLLVRRTVV